MTHEKKSWTAAQRMAWIEAVKTTAYDASAKVTCPICESGTLILEVVYTHPGYHPDKRLYCDSCGAYVTMSGAPL